MSDFDEFLKENQESELETKDNVDKTTYKSSILKQLKEVINYSGSDLDDEILIACCEEFRDICNREAGALQAQIDEIKERKYIKIEHSSKSDIKDRHKVSDYELNDLKKSLDSGFYGDRKEAKEKGT